MSTTEISLSLPKEKWIDIRNILKDYTTTIQISLTYNKHLKENDKRLLEKGIIDIDKHILKINELCQQSESANIRAVEKPADEKRSKGSFIKSRSKKLVSGK